MRDIVSSLFHAFSARRYARQTQKLSRPVPEGAGLLEVYVQRDSFEGGKFLDRYYPGLFDSMDAAQQARLFYLPVFHRIRDYRALFTRLRQAAQNFFLREDYLTWSDYGFAFGHWVRAANLKGMRACFCGFDIGPMLDAELDTGRFSNASIQALLAYRFWRYRAPAAIGAVVDWYEGHGLDHATAAAMRWHGQDDRLVAMRPVAPEAYLSLTPTIGEVEAHVVARRWAVIGVKAQKAMAEAFPQLKIGPSPGLRHLGLRDVAPRKTGIPLRVLIVLSIEADLARLVASVVSAADGDAVWLVKRHPAMPSAEAEALFASLRSRVTFVEGDFASLLTDVDVVAGLGTNTLIEAATLGIPVICISGGNMPTELLFGPDPGVWWRMAYDGPDLSLALAQAHDIPTIVRKDLQDAYLGPFDPAILRGLLFGPT